jgi:hypothetical protein
MAEIKRSDFVFTIGYQGDTAIVDGSARKRYGKLGARELLEKGLYRSAFCAALYDGELETFLPEFRNETGIDAATPAALQRMYGVFGTPDAITKVSVIS